MAFTKIVGAGIHTLSNVHTHNINSSGIITATQFVGIYSGTDGDFSGNVSIGGSLTVNGDFTTLNTTLREVEILNVDANSSEPAGIITQTGSGDILNLYDDSTEVFSVIDGGDVGIARSIFHLNDLDTHIGFPAANQVKITAGNEVNTTFTSSTVGFNKKLVLRSSAVIDQEVSESDATVPTLRIRNTGNHTLASFQNTNTASTIIQWNDYGSSVGAGNLIFRSSNSGNEEHARITGAGKVGIGTNNPATELDVQGDITIRNGSEQNAIRTSSAGKLQFLRNGASNNLVTLTIDDTDGKVAIGTDSANSRLRVHNDSDDSAIIWVSGADVVTEYLSLGIQPGKAIFRGGGTGGTSTAVVFEHSNAGTEAEGMRLHSDGNVGIGSAIPTDKLDIQTGSSDEVTKFKVKIAGQLELTRNHASAPYIKTFMSSGNPEIRLGDSSGDKAIIKVDGDSYLNGGNFGVGTNNPNYKTVIQTSDTTAYSASTITANQFQLAISNSGANGVAGILLATEPSSGNGGHCGIRALSTGSGDSALTFSTRGSATSAERLRIAADGNVHINMTDNGTASAKLNIEDSSAAGKNILLLSNKPSGANGRPKLVFHGETTLGQGASPYICGIMGSDAGGDNAGNNGGLEFHTSAGGSGTDYTAMTIRSNSKVGIGETFPDERLHISNTGTCKLRITDNRTSISNTSQYGVIQFEQRDSNTPGVSLEMAAVMEDTTNGATGLQIKTGTPSTIAERLRVDRVGRTFFTNNTGSAVSRVGGRIEVSQNSPETWITINESSDSGTGPALYINRTRGTNVASPSPVTSGNYLGSIHFGSYDTNSYEIGASIIAWADDATWANNDCPTRLTFHTVSDNPADRVSEERLRIRSDGNIGINQTNPNRAKLHVVGGTANPTIVAKFKGSSGADARTKIGLAAAYSDTANDTEGHAYVGALRNGSGNTTSLFFEVSQGSSLRETARIHNGGVQATSFRFSSNASTDAVLPNTHYIGDVSSNSISYYHNAGLYYVIATCPTDGNWYTMFTSFNDSASNFRGVCGDASSKNSFYWYFNPTSPSYGVNPYGEKWHHGAWNTGSVTFRLDGTHPNWNLQIKCTSYYGTNRTASLRAVLEVYY